MISGLYAGVTTLQLDNLAAEIAATMTTKHADYAILAARIVASNLQKETKKSFSGKIKYIYLANSHWRSKKKKLFCAYSCHERSLQLCGSNHE